MSAITSYHAHVYFDAARREDARQLCERAVRSSASWSVACMINQ